MQRKLKQRKWPIITLVLFLVSTFTLFYHPNSASAYIDHTNYGLQEWTYNPSTNITSDASRVRIGSGEYKFGRVSIIVGGSDVGKVMALVKQPMTSNNGYLYIEKSYASQWITFFGGEPTYVNQQVNANVETLKLPNGTTKTVINFAKLASWCGARPDTSVDSDSYDAGTKRSWFKKSAWPIANVAFEGGKTSFTVGETGKVRGFGQIYITDYDVWFEMSMAGMGKTFVNNEKKYATQYTTPYYDVKFDSPGTYKFSIRVRDSAYRLATKEITVTVTGGTSTSWTPPPAPTPSPPPAPSGNIYVDFDMPAYGDPNTNIDIIQKSVAAKCGYSNGYIKEYKWTVSPSNVSPSTGSWPGWNNKVKFLSSGTYTVTLWAKDNCGNEGTKTKSITISAGDPPPPPEPENIAPVARISAPSSSNIGKSVFISGSGSYDPDNGPSSLSYDWDISPSSGVDGSLSGTSGSVTFTKEGTYTITLTVDDGEDSDTETDTIEVVNRPPKAVLDMPTEAIQGDEVTIENRSYDPNGDQITVIKWTIPPNADMKDPVAETPVTTLNDDKTKVYFDTPGEYEFTLYVEDEWGKSDQISQKIVIKPAIPVAYYKWGPGSYPKENRKMIFDATDSTSSKRYPIVWEKTEWQYVPPTGVTADQVKVVNDPDLSIRNLLFKKRGVYNVRIRVTNTAGNTSEWFERPVEIFPDNNPIVDFYVASAATRDENKNAAITLMDQSYSDDDDIISKRVWRYKFDSNNDGNFLDESWVTLDGGNNPAPTLNTDKVGWYLFELYVEESFGQDTIPQFIVPEDTRKGDTTSKPVEEKKVEVINLRPMVSFGPVAKKTADIVFTIGQVDKAKIADLNGKITQQMKTKFASYNIDAKISSVETTAMSMQDTFQWQEYSHYYTDSAYSGRTVNGTWTNNHIIVNGKDITFYGYDSRGAKDFLFMPDTQASKKTFDFFVNENQTDWHTLEGAGYLFNAKIQSNILSGYAIILAQTNIQLWEIGGVNVNDFHAGTISSMSGAGTLIGTFPKNGTQHQIVVEATPDKIDMWDNGIKIIDSKPLTNKYGNGYGPMVSYFPHGCSSLSYITFKNIKMETLTGKSFDEVLKEPDWISNSHRFVANISDVEIPEFNDPQKSSVIYSRMLKDAINFAGLGTNTNQAQIQKIIGVNDGNGIFINNSNMDTALSQYADYIISILNANSGLSDHVLLEQEIDYETFYSDAENDPEIQRRWKFDHTDPNYFQNSLGLAPYHSQWLPGSVNKFSHVGEFTVSFQAKDEPRYTDGTFNELFGNYRLWSWEPEVKLKLYVHRKPLAIFSPVLTPANAFDFNLSINESSYDIDHEFESGKGIVQRTWKWKYAEDTYWNNGMPPTYIQGGKTMLIYLRVLDPEGVWSDPEVKVVTTSGNMPPVANFKFTPNPLPISKSLTYTDFSYDPNSDPIVEYRWRSQPVGGAWTDHGISPGTNFASTAPKSFGAIGEYRVELTVKDDKGAWSEPFYQVVRVIPDNKPPIALFDLLPSYSIPQDVQMSYQDKSYDQDSPPDPLVAWEWRMKRTTDVSWTTIPEPPSDLSGYTPGQYQIQLRVKDQPALSQLDPLWSNWFERILTILPKNEKPVANLELSPNPVPADEPLTWLDKSTDPEGRPLTAYELRLTHQESGMVRFFTDNYSKSSGASMDMSSSFIQIFETSGFPNDGAGTYRVEYRVRDTSPNNPPAQSPQLWSDWQVQTLIVEDPLRIVGGVEPPVARSGQAIKLISSTEGKAQNVYAYIDWNRDGDTNDESEIVILSPQFDVSSKMNDWEAWVIIPLPTQDGIYEITYRATKISPWDGSIKEVTDTKNVTVQGDIFDDFIMEYYH